MRSSARRPGTERRPFRLESGGRTPFRSATARRTRPPREQAARAKGVERVHRPGLRGGAAAGRRSRGPRQRGLDEAVEPSSEGATQRGRLRLTDEQRRRLAAKGKRIGRRLLAQVATIVTPDTISIASPRARSPRRSGNRAPSPHGINRPAGARFSRPTGRKSPRPTSSRLRCGRRPACGPTTSREAGGGRGEGCAKCGLSG